MENPLRSLTLSMLLLTVASSCAHKPDEAPIMVGGVALNPDPWLEDREQLTRRASFDLDCAAEQLTITILATGGDDLSSGKSNPSEIYWDDWAVQVGLSGCDRRAVYVRTSKGWIANAHGGAAAAPPASSP